MCTRFVVGLYQMACEVKLSINSRSRSKFFSFVMDVDLSVECTSAVCIGHRQLAYLLPPACNLCVPPCFVPCLLVSAWLC